MGRGRKKSIGRKRRPRLGGRIAAVARTDENKERRQKRIKAKGDQYSRRHRSWSDRRVYDRREWQHLIDFNKKQLTFEEEYRLFKKTRGRKGLNPDENHRGSENFRQLNRDSVFNCGYFPITELMQKPIKTSRHFRIR